MAFDFKSLLSVKFTTNARTIAALVAIAISAYGITMLTWLDQNQQQEIELQPRESTPDFLVTQAHYIQYAPTLNQSDDTTVGAPQMSIRSQQLSHFEENKETQFDQPTIEFSDKSGESWLITAQRARVKASNETQNDTIDLRGNVLVTSLSEQEISLESNGLSINPSTQTISSPEEVTLHFKGGQVSSGNLWSDIGSGKLSLQGGVQAVYQQH